MNTLEICVCEYFLFFHSLFIFRMWTIDLNIYNFPSTMRKCSILPFTLLSIGKCWPTQTSVSMNWSILSRDLSCDIWPMLLWLHESIYSEFKENDTKHFFYAPNKIWLIDFYLSNHVPFDQSHNSRETGNINVLD